MRYATVANLVNRFGEDEIRQRTDRNLTGEIDEAVANAALDKATALVDTRLRRLYAVPLAEVPIEIRDITAVLARWKLYDDRVPESIAKDAEMALSELDRIASGKTVLDLPPATAGGTTAGLPQAEAPAREFTRDTLRDFG